MTAVLIGGALWAAAAWLIAIGVGRVTRRRDRQAPR